MTNNAIYVKCNESANRIMKNMKQDEIVKMGKQLEKDIKTIKFGKDEVGAHRYKSINNSSKQVESWIEEFLMEAEKKNLKSTQMVYENESGLARQKLSPVTLKKIGLDKLQIERIQNVIFIHSIGFYEAIREVLGKFENNQDLLSSIWIVYNILIEFCSRSEYETSITAITTEQKSRINNVNNNLKDEIKQFKKLNEDNIAIIKGHEKTITNFTSEVALQHQTIEELETKISNLRDQQEKEISLRLSFEQKLNTQVELQRALESRFCVISKEFEVNSNVLHKNYLQLTKFRIENEGLRKNTSYMEGRFFQIKEKQELGQESLKSKDQLLDKLRHQYNVVYNELIALKEDRFKIESKSQDLSRKLNLAEDQKSALEQGLEIEGEKMIHLNQIIENQDKNFKGMVESLKKAENESLTNKNSLGLMHIQINDQKRNLDAKTTELNILYNNNMNLTEINAKLTIENESFSFNIKKLSGELLEAIIRQNVITRTFKAEENLSQKLAQQIKELNTKILDLENEVKLQRLESIGRQAKINEIQVEKEYLQTLIEDNRTIHEQSIQSQVVQIQNQTVLLEKQEEINQTYQAYMTSSKREQKDMVQIVNEAKDEKRRAQLKVSSITQEIQLLKKSQEELQNEHNTFKQHQYNQEFKHEDERNKLDSQRDMLNNIKRDEEITIRNIYNKQYGKIEKLNINIFKLSSTIEDYHTVLGNLEEQQYSLLQKQSDRETEIEKLKESLETKEIENQNNLTLYQKQIEKNTQTINHMTTLQSQKENIENRFKILKNKEDQFKSEIKRQNNLITEQEGALLTLQKSNENYITRLAKLDNFLLKSQDAKEYSFAQNSALLKKAVNTTITGEQNTGDNKVVKKKVQEEPQNKKVNIITIRNQFNSLQEDYQKFKDQLQKTHLEIKGDEKCPYCLRQGNGQTINEENEDNRENDEIEEEIEADNNDEISGEWIYQERALAKKQVQKSIKQNRKSNIGNLIKATLSKKSLHSSIDESQNSPLHSPKFLRDNSQGNFSSPSNKGSRVRLKNDLSGSKNQFTKQ